MCERVIMAPKGITLNNLSGNEHNYKFLDSVDDDSDIVNYLVEFLDTLEPRGAPPLCFILKRDSPTMLQGKLSQRKLCPRTRLVVKKLMRNFIVATIISCCGKG